MTNFSEYQIRRFQLIFNQHADYATPVADAGSKPPSHSLSLARSASFHSDTQQEKNLNYPSLTEALSNKLQKSPSKLSHLGAGSDFGSKTRLTPGTLALVLKYFGPPVTVEVAKSIIFKYDTHCQGFLDFEDFLQFLKDYASVIEAKRDNAFRIFSSRKNDALKAIKASVFHPSSHSHILRVLLHSKNESEFLTSLSLSDSDFLWSAEDSFTKSIKQLGLVLAYPFLNRTIGLRVMNADNVSAFARLKFRKEEGFLFNTLDPFIKLFYGGKSKQTTALLGELYPHWDQEILFDINIFPGETMDILQWALSQYFEIYLYDYNSDGALAHGELLAHGSFPMAPILFSCQRPMELSIPLQSCDGFNRKIVVHLHATDKSPEHVAFTKLLDACQAIEPFWISKFSEKMKSDLLQQSLLKDLNTTRSLPTLQNPWPINGSIPLKSEDFWEYYRTTIHRLARLFPKRDFAAIGIDELNIFRPLTSFLSPLSYPGFVSYEEVSFSVSELPFYSPIHPYSETTLYILNKLPGPILEKFRPYSMPISYAYFKPCCLSETRFTRISTPASFVSRGHGTMTDHAILLCSFFLGLQIDAYVAFGLLHENYHAWVVTFGEFPKVHSSSSPDILPKFMDEIKTKEPKCSYISSEFAYKDKLQQTSTKNTLLHAQLWDVYTGSSILLTKAPLLFNVRIHTLFNNKNIWMNIQNSDFISRPVFSWDLSNPEAWFPFFTTEAQDAFEGTLKRFYPSPYSLFNPILSFPMDDEETLTELKLMIQKYRLSHLFIYTDFHEAFSQWLASKIPELEECRLFNKPYPSLELNLEIPQSCCFAYRLLLLRGRPTTQAVFHHIVSSGMIDCSVTGSAITLALRSYDRNLGTNAIWIGIGYLAKTLKI